MNRSALMEYISYQLHTAIKMIDYNFNLIESFCGIREFNDPLLQTESNLKSICSKAAKNTPHIFFIDEQLVYSIIDIGEGYYLVGPVQFHGSVALKYDITDLNTDTYQLNEITYVDWDKYATDIAFIFNLYHENTLSNSDIVNKNCIDKSLNENIQKDFTNILFNINENNSRHNPYDQEVREQTAIEHGDTDMLRRSIAEDYTGKIGTLSKDKMRNMKNVAIVVITLASRAAIRGGMSSEVSFSLSDEYIQKIEETRDINILMHLTRGAEFQYAQMVHDIIEQRKGLGNRESNPKVNQCKDYIFSHLHDKLTVKDLALALELNANYLSEIFKKSEGITLSKYILNEKIARAKNLLIYSDYSYIDIATYLGFSSQSHLSTHFKNVTGYTLKEFRVMFGTMDTSTL